MENSLKIGHFILAILGVLAIGMGGWVGINRELEKSKTRQDLFESQQKTMMEYMLRMENKVDRNNDQTSEIKGDVKALMRLLK